MDEGNKDNAVDRKRHKHHHHHGHHHRHRRHGADDDDNEAANQHRRDKQSGQRATKEGSKNEPCLEEAPDSGSSIDEKHTALADQFEERMRMKLEEENHVPADSPETAHNPAGQDEELESDTKPEVSYKTAADQLDQYEQRMQRKLEKEQDHATPIVDTDDAPAHDTPSVTIPVRDRESGASNPTHRPDVCETQVRIDSQSTPPESLPKGNAWKSVASFFGKHKRQVQVDGQAQRCVSGTETPFLVDENCDHVIIPEATLVEVDTNARFKRRRLIIGASIVAIVVVVAGVVAASNSKQKTEAFTEQPLPPGSKLTPEDVRDRNGYNLWIRPVSFGEREIYYGATCNALATSCSKCGLYEVRKTTNQVIGECNYCNVCAGGGFEADCENIAGGRFNCQYLEEPEPMPDEFDYEQWFCPFSKGERMVCTGMADCYPGVGLCATCGVYELKVNSTEVVGKCNTCRPCMAGGLDSDCTNIGHGKFQCYFPEEEDQQR